MKSKEFVGVVGINKGVPNGSVISVAFGHIISEDDDKFEAIGFQIKDHNNQIVTEFALQPETFGCFLDAIKELYDELYNDTV